MCIIFTIKEETYGRWGIYRGSDLLISQRSVSAAIADARELARLVHAQSGADVNVAIANSGASILLESHVVSEELVDSEAT